MPPVNVIGVIGAGTMGSGIAQVFAQAGLDVRLEDTAAVALDHARRTIESSLSRFLAKGTLTATQRDETLARLATSTELETLADVDYVIEAILEDTGRKTSVVWKARCPRATIRHPPRPTPRPFPSRRSGAPRGVPPGSSVCIS